MNERYKDYLRLLGLGLVFFLLETAVLPLFSFRLGKPDFILLFVSAVALYVGFLPGMITGLVMGLLMDGLFSPGLGPWMLIYLAVAWIFIRIRESDWEVEKIYLTLIMGGITVLSYGMMTFFLFFYGYQYSFLREVLPFMIGEAIANMGFWIAVLWLFPKIIREAGKDYMSTLQ